MKGRKTKVVGPDSLCLSVCPSVYHRDSLIEDSEGQDVCMNLSIETVEEESWNIEVEEESWNIEVEEESWNIEVEEESWNIEVEEESWTSCRMASYNVRICI